MYSALGLSTELSTFQDYDNLILNLIESTAAKCCFLRAHF